MHYLWESSNENLYNFSNTYTYRDASSRSWSVKESLIDTQIDWIIPFLYNKKIIINKTLLHG
jgi:hypothetical protein